MKLIADSGSTKTEWILLKDKTSILHTFTIGLNPFISNVVKRIIYGQTKISFFNNLANYYSL